MLPLYDNSLCHKVVNFLFFSEAIWGKYWEEDVGLLGLAVQSNSSNCLALIHLDTGDTFAMSAWGHIHFVLHLHCHILVFLAYLFIYYWIRIQISILFTCLFIYFSKFSINLATIVRFLQNTILLPTHVPVGNVVLKVLKIHTYMTPKYILI